MKLLGRNGADIQYKSYQVQTLGKLLAFANFPTLPFSSSSLLFEVIKVEVDNV